MSAGVPYFFKQNTNEHFFAFSTYTLGKCKRNRFINCIIIIILLPKQIQLNLFFLLTLNFFQKLQKKN